MNTYGHLLPETQHDAVQKPERGCPGLAGGDQLPPALVLRLREALPWDREVTAAELNAHLLAAGVVLNSQQQHQVWDALAVAAYHAQTGVPIVRWLLSDDAADYHRVTDEHGLCWVRDGCHYAKLSPVVPLHRQLLADVRRDEWAFYRSWAPLARRRARRSVRA